MGLQYISMSKRYTRKNNLPVAIVIVIVMAITGLNTWGDSDKESPDYESSKQELTQLEQAENFTVDFEDDVENGSAENNLYQDSQSGNEAYEILNNNQPEFSNEEKQSTEAFETYSELDSLGRCGVAYANICQELMPTEKRGEIGMIKPTGWHTIKYDFVDGKYLYNRCHLIAFCLAGENANEKNLITGTRYMNTQGMLPFEEKVARYVDDTNNHVLYRVTPVFEGDNLLASGVQIEAYSVEDAGAGICFNVYCYNIQPGVKLNYVNGDSELE